MSRNFTRHLVLSILAALAAVPAWVQFKISPDHFGDPPSTIAHAATRMESVCLEVTRGKTRLKSYRKPIERKAAEVEEAKQFLVSPRASADEVGESAKLRSEHTQSTAAATVHPGTVRESAPLKTASARAVAHRDN
jgi:hypothetical protein